MDDLTMVSALERCGIDCRWNEGRGKGMVCCRERETASSRGPAAQRRSCFLPLLFSFLPFSSHSTFPLLFSISIRLSCSIAYCHHTLTFSILANLFHQFYCFYLAFLSIESPFLPFPFLICLLFSVISHLTHQIPLSDLPIHLVIFQQVERQSHSRLCRPRSCTSCP